MYIISSLGYGPYSQHYTTTVELIHYKKINNYNLVWYKYTTNLMAPSNVPGLKPKPSPMSESNRSPSTSRS